MRTGRNLGGRSNVSRPVAPITVPPKRGAGLVGGMTGGETYQVQVPVTLTESFNKADGLPLGPDLSWSQVTDGAKNSGNGAILDGGVSAEVGGAMATTDAVTGYGISYPNGGLEPDMTVSLDCVSFAGNSLDVIGRSNFATDVNGMVTYAFSVRQFFPNWIYTVHMYGPAAAMDTTIDTTFPVTSVISPVGKRLTLSCVGSTISGSVDGSVIVSGVDTFIPSADIEVTMGNPYFAGFLFNIVSINASSAKVDNFQIDGTLPGYRVS